MDSNGFERKISAILSADVLGYSRLMHDDKEVTVHTLNDYKKMIFNLVEGSQGRLVFHSPLMLSRIFLSGSEAHCEFHHRT